MIDREAISTELAEIEHMLQDTRLSLDTRFALMGASQALRHVLDPETWQSASQNVLSSGRRADEAAARATRL
ncbi:hypothetical protein ACQR1W_27120 [Bradyrhizobium sp. HKCCYLS1011]|uniref:hypothetical protein n=1 Tax=Bradyrhizobium sp. HKCCYLS1011 TaxID=3420733 RepID=UPI003EBA23DA